MRLRRNKNGSIIAFSVALAFVLIVLGVAFIFLLLYMGGQHETKNAADAGALNVGKQVLDNITVPVEPGNFFVDCCYDNDHGPTNNFSGNADLRNINRIWAKAILVGINADAMSKDQQLGSGGSNALAAHDGAKAISDSLSQKLNTASLLYGFFSDYSAANSVRMIGDTVQTTQLPGSGWQTSLMDRTPITTGVRESNITINGNPSNNFNLPPGYSLPGAYHTPSTRNPPVSSANGLTFLSGYTGMNLPGGTFWQVPFQYDEKPRLVSQTVFDQSTIATTPLGWDNAVPNAFSVEGLATKANAPGEKAKSWVLTNPRKTFQMALPHSFLHIHLDEMKSHWYFFPFGPIEIENPIGSPQSYGYMLTSQESDMPGGGILCTDVDSGDVEIGLDVVGDTLDDVIFGMPKSDSKIEQFMVNRINEMITKVGTSYDANYLHNQLLGALWTRADLYGDGSAGPRDYWIYSPDGETLTLVSDHAKIGPLWLMQMINNAPDGTETQISDDKSLTIPDPLPIVTPAPTCTLLPPPLGDFGWSDYEKVLNLQPGTGYNGCLGQVRVTRSTNVHSLGACVETVI